MRRHLGLCLAAAMVSSACATKYSAHRESPWNHGIEFRVSPRVEQLTFNQAEIRPSVGYERTFSPGLNLLSFGGQVRFIPEALAARQWWVGGEAVYVLTLPGPTHGSRVGGILGIPLRLRGAIGERASTHFVAGAGVILPGNGVYFSVGLEFNPKK